MISGASERQQIFWNWELSLQPAESAVFLRSETQRLSSGHRNSIALCYDVTGTKEHVEIIKKLKKRWMGSFSVTRETCEASAKRNRLTPVLSKVFYF